MCFKVFIERSQRQTSLKFDMFYCQHNYLQRQTFSMFLFKCFPCFYGSNLCMLRFIGEILQIAFPTCIEKFK
jgi:hypothetical protein